MKCKTDAEQSEARNFFEKIYKKGPKIHCLALKLYTGPPNCITGASKSGGQGGPGPPDPPPDPLVGKGKVRRTECFEIHNFGRKT